MNILYVFWTDGLATFFYEMTATPASVGDEVLVEGVDPDGLNGTFTVVATTVASCSVAMADPGPYVKGGTLEVLP